MSDFQSFGLNEAILRAISELGFETPTPIQEKMIPHLLNTPGDVVGLAQTGTGKTAAFGLPILNFINPKSRLPQALILSPTRELALQITRDLESFSKYLPGVSLIAVYGGAPIDRQIRAIKSGVQIVVATPGRMLDLINRKVVDFSKVEYLVLDEADEMLNMGFREELDAILENVPSERNTLLFSATMQPDVARIASNYMKKPTEITVGKKNSGSSTIQHIVHLIHEKDRYEVVKRIADSNPDIYGIVFCRTRIETQDISDKLRKDGYNAEALHGDLSQSQRDYVMGKFRDGHIRILVATDVAARGLDVNNLSHVINYNLPDDVEVYTHRSGRTGRAGRTGICISIINLKEKFKIRSIERTVQTSLQVKPVPTGAEILGRQLHSLIDKIHTVEIKEENIAPYLSDIQEKLLHIDRETLIKKMISMEFSQYFERYSKMKDLNVIESGDRPDRKRFDREAPRDQDGGRFNRDSGRGDREFSGSRDHGDRGNATGAEPGFSRVFINLGKMDGLTPKDLIGIINEVSRKRNIEIGRIDLGKTFTFFELDEKFARKVVEDFQGTEYNGRPLQVEFAKKDTGPASRFKPEFRERGGSRNHDRGGYKGKPRRDR
ncbi:MAG: DEAD/DEAH box helicase [Bacteroidetes bacterium]|nr:DEAD/DEAH box helicase [Bacteroidota bacterium]